MSLAPAAPRGRAIRFSHFEARDLEIVRLHQAHMNCTAIGLIVHLTPSGVHNVISRRASRGLLGYELRKLHPWTLEDNGRMVELLALGFSVAEVARRLRRGQTLIRRHIAVHNGGTLTDHAKKPDAKPHAPRPDTPALREFRRRYPGYASPEAAAKVDPARTAEWCDILNEQRALVGARDITGQGDATRVTHEYTSQEKVRA